MVPVLTLGEGEVTNGTSWPDVDLFRLVHYNLTFLSYQIFVLATSKKRMDKAIKYYEPRYPKPDEFIRESRGGLSTTPYPKGYLPVLLNKVDLYLSVKKNCPLNFFLEAAMGRI